MCGVRGEAQLTNDQGGSPSPPHNIKSIASATYAAKRIFFCASVDPSGAVGIPLRTSNPDEEERGEGVQRGRAVQTGQGRSVAKARRTRAIEGQRRGTTQESRGRAPNDSYLAVYGEVHVLELGEGHPCDGGSGGVTGRARKRAEDETGQMRDSRHRFEMTKTVDRPISRIGGANWPASKLSVGREIVAEAISWSNLGRDLALDLALTQSKSI